MSQFEARARLAAGRDMLFGEYEGAFVRDLQGMVIGTVLRVEQGDGGPVLILELTDVPEGMSPIYLGPRD